MTEGRIRRAEWLVVLAGCAAASLLAAAWSWRHGAMLNYGDAVAHLHIARRVIDSRRPGLSELGSVWLPLPHLLMIPFVAVYAWWANGVAGLIPSALAYLAGCAGVYRLARRWLRPRGVRGGAGIFRAESQPALHADHGHDRAAVCVRDDLGVGVAGGVAGCAGSFRRTQQLSAAARIACSIGLRWRWWRRSLRATTDG